MRGRLFGTMPSGSTVADQLARSAGAHGEFGTWRPTHKESRPGVKVNIIIAYYSRSGAVVRLLRLAKPAALKRALALLFSAQHSS